MKTEEGVVVGLFNEIRISVLTGTRAAGDRNLSVAPTKFLHNCIVPWIAQLRPKIVRIAVTTSHLLEKKSTRRRGIEYFKEDIFRTNLQTFPVERDGD